MALYKRSRKSENREEPEISSGMHGSSGKSRLAVQGHPKPEAPKARILHRVHNC